MAVTAAGVRTGPARRHGVKQLQGALFWTVATRFATGRMTIELLFANFGPLAERVSVGPPTDRLFLCLAGQDARCYFFNDGSATPHSEQPLPSDVSESSRQSAEMSRRLGPGLPI